MGRNARSRRSPRLVTLSAGLAAQIWRRNGGTLRIALKRSRRLGLGCRPAAADRMAPDIGRLCMIGRDRWRPRSDPTAADVALATPPWSRACPAAWLREIGRAHV